MTKTIVNFIGGFLIGLVVVWLWQTYAAQSPRDVESQNSAPNGLVAEDSTENISGEDAIANESVETTPESTRISVNDQPAGERVTVASVTLERDGWVVVHEENNGFIGNALGAARLDAGTHANIFIPTLRTTLANGRYWIVLYSDNGDRQFNLRDDFPLRDSNNNPVTASFQTQ